MPVLKIRHAGLISYSEGLALQERLMAGVIEEKMKHKDNPGGSPLPDNHLIICEHPPVYTMGNRGGSNNLLMDEAGRAAAGIEFFQTRRGGDITYHGPGQLVVYPILDLDQFFTDIHKFLRLLEESVIQTLAEFGIGAGRVEGLTGVWTGFEKPETAKKICAMGVRCSRWVTQHGLALNVNTNLRHFEGIIPCGISDHGVTSMLRETAEPHALDAVAARLIAHFKTLFLLDV